MSLTGGTCTYFTLAEERTPVAILSPTCDLVLGPCRMNVMVRAELLRLTQVTEQWMADTAEKEPVRGWRVLGLPPGMTEQDVAVVPYGKVSRRESVDGGVGWFLSFSVTLTDDAGTRRQVTSDVAQNFVRDWTELQDDPVRAAAVRQLLALWERWGVSQRHEVCEHLIDARCELAPMRVYRSVRQLGTEVLVPAYRSTAGQFGAYADWLRRLLLAHDPDPEAVWQDVTDAPCPASRVATRSWLTYEEHPMGLMDARCKVCGAPFLSTVWFVNPVSVDVIEELAQCMRCVDASTSLTPDVLCDLRQYTDRQNERLLNAAQASDALEEERGA